MSPHKGLFYVKEYAHGKEQAVIPLSPSSFASTNTPKSLFGTQFSINYFGTLKDKQKKLFRSTDEATLKERANLCCTQMVFYQKEATIFMILVMLRPLGSSLEISVVLQQKYILNPPASVLCKNLPGLWQSLIGVNFAPFVIQSCMQLIVNPTCSNINRRNVRIPLLFQHYRIKNLISYRQLNITSNNNSITTVMMPNKATFQEQFEIQDPFLGQGGTIICQTQRKFDICIQQKGDVQKLPNPQILTIKIALIQEHGSPKTIKLQLTSDADLYFNFICSCNDWDFKRIRQKQNLYIEFRQYPLVILKTLEKLINEQNKFCAIFTIFSDSQGKMDIIRHSQFRDHTILSFDFLKASEQQIKKGIQYRYDCLRQQYAENSKNFEEITQIVRSKNPGLMMQIDKILKKRG